MKEELMGMEKLKQENKDLKKALSICLNKPLISRLHKAIKKIEKGEYYTEKQFFKNSRRLSV